MDEYVVEVDIGGIGASHYFTYKKKKYPFSFEMFSLFSQLYKRNPEVFQGKNEIKLIEDEERINLSEESIKDFIQYCHNIRKQINNENVISLNYLAKKYQVNQLIDSTEEYKKKHINELKFQIYLFDSNQNEVENIQIEKEISENLSLYIQNKQLLALPIHSIFRILNNSLNNINDLNELMNFLFECLDKYGRSASILFSNIDFKNLQMDCLTVLLSKYLDIFDFHFINPICMKSLYELQNEQIKKEKLIKIEQIKTMKALYDEINELKKNQRELLEMIKNQQENFIQLLNKATEKKEINQDFKYDPNCQLKGIIYHLTNECGGNVHDEGIVSVYSSSANNIYIPKNAVEFLINDSINYFHSNNENGAWIQYNFKKMSVKPTHYEIKTSLNSVYFPRSWVIEALNNCSGCWKVLDSRNNVKHINAPNSVYVFEISEKLDEDEYYRFIRFRVTGTNSSGYNYLVLKTLEYYGSIKKYQ